MACRGCGSDRKTTRTLFNPDGTFRAEECPSCAPGSFDPQWLTAKGATAWEAYPDKYIKFSLNDGRVGYRATDEWQTDSEDKIRKSYEKADQVEASALENKRRNRRTTPMTPEEIAKATNKWRPYFEDRIEKGNQAWNAAISQLTQ